MKKKMLFFDILEFWIPIIIISVTAIYLFSNYCFPSMIKLNFIEKILLHIEKSIGGLASLFATLGAVFCGIILTSLSVFGSTASHSIIELSKNEGATSKFMLYATSSLLGSALLLIFSIFHELINMRIYFFVFVFSLATLFSYITASLIMFYLNIKYIEQEKKAEEKLLREVSQIKRHILTIKIDIEDSIKKKNQDMQEGNLNDKKDNSPK